jgi:hypothetical protein
MARAPTHYSIGKLSLGAIWAPLTNGVVTLGNNFVLTNDASAAAAFYRLHGQ